MNLSDRDGSRQLSWMLGLLKDDGSARVYTKNWVDERHKTLQHRLVWARNKRAILQLTPATVPIPKSLKINASFLSTGLMEFLEKEPSCFFTLVP